MSDRNGGAIRDGDLEPMSIVTSGGGCEHDDVGRCRTPLRIVVPFVLRDGDVRVWAGLTLR